MDRPKKGSTITIKINGENKAYQEELQKGRTEDSKAGKPKIVELYPKQPDKGAIKETAAAQEAEDESFDWIIPESSEYDSDEIKVLSNKERMVLPNKSGGKKTVSFSNYKKKNGRPITSILITAFFAILIGTTIGVFMLKLVMTESNEKAATDPEVTVETEGTETSTAKTTSAVIKQETTFVIQGGVFASKEGADETVNQLETLGVPSQSIKMDDKYYLFLGVADSIEAAKSLGVHYKENGVADVFAKPLLVGEKNVSGLTEKEKSFLEAVPTIYQTLSMVTSRALITNQIPADGESVLASIQKQLKVSGIKNEKVKSMKTELAGAEEQVKEFESSKDAKSISKAQQHLLKFLATYISI